MLLLVVNERKRRQGEKLGVGHLLQRALHGIIPNYLHFPFLSLTLGSQTARSSGSTIHKDYGTGRYSVTHDGKGKRARRGINERDWKDR